jgi:NAD(P)H dehydrogenase (quinone)
MIGLTAATGRLGRLVIAELLQRVPPDRVVARARDLNRASDLAAQGITVRPADYDDPATLDAALRGTQRLLLISGNEVGRRVQQHRNVIAAAVRAGVQLLADTSLLHADRSPLRFLALEHPAPERALQESGHSSVILRDGWYTENCEDRARHAAAIGELVRAAGTARLSPASRADYAVAAAVVLTGDGHAGQIDELAGDEAWPMADLAQAISEVVGRPIALRQASPAEYRAFLLPGGTPEPIADVLLTIETSIAPEALFDDSRTLSRLSGRPTTSLRTILRTWLRA